jgi:hypothetical protein
VSLNVVGVQEKQHENELIAVFRGQVDLQHQFLAGQEGHIQQNDVKVAELAARVGFMEGTGASVSQLSVMGPPAERAPQLIMGGAQPPGYSFVGQNPGMVIWGHPDDDDDDVFYLFLQKQKRGAELHIYLEEGTYHKRLFRGPNTNDMKK